MSILRNGKLHLAFRIYSYLRANYKSSVSSSVRETPCRVACNASTCCLVCSRALALAARHGTFLLKLLLMNVAVLELFT